MKRVSLKGLLFVTPIVITLYGAVVGHAWADAAIGWVMTLLIGYYAWHVAGAFFRTTATPWRTSANVAKVIAGLAAFYAIASESYGDDDSMIARASVTFLTASFVMGGPAAVAAYQHRKRFPDPDANARPPGSSA